MLLLDILLMILRALVPLYVSTKKLEKDAKTVVDHQRRLNPKMKEVVRNEILKLMEAGIIYPVDDSEWVSPVHCVPKKGGITVVPNDKNELIPQRIVTGYRMVIDFRKLNKATRKDHYPLPFIDQMLKRLSKHTHFCFLDGYSGFSDFYLCQINQKLPLLALLELTLIDICLLVYAMHLLPFKDV